MTHIPDLQQRRTEAFSVLSQPHNLGKNGPKATQGRSQHRKATWGPQRMNCEEAVESGSTSAAGRLSGAHRFPPQHATLN